MGYMIGHYLVFIGNLFIVCPANILHLKDSITCENSKVLFFRTLDIPIRSQHVCCSAAVLRDTFDLRAPSPQQIAAHTANKRGIIIYTTMLNIVLLIKYVTSFIN